MDVTMSWLSLFCFGYTYYELCTTKNWLYPIGYIQLDISNFIYPIGYTQLDISNWLYPIGYIQLDMFSTKVRRPHLL